MCKNKTCIFFGTYLIQNDEHRRRKCIRSHWGRGTASEGIFFQKNWQKQKPKYRRPVQFLRLKNKNIIRNNDFCTFLFLSGVEKPNAKYQISLFWFFVAVAIWKEKRPGYLFFFLISTRTNIKPMKFLILFLATAATTQQTFNLKFI